MTFVKWPSLLVWHVERVRVDAGGRRETECGLLVSADVLRVDRRPRKPARVCRQCERELERSEARP